MTEATSTNKRRTRATKAAQTAAEAIAAATPTTDTTESVAASGEALVAVPALTYTDPERDALLRIALALVGPVPYGTHQQAVANRFADALAHAEVLLPIYLNTAYKDATNG